MRNHVLVGWLLATSLLSLDSAALAQCVGPPAGGTTHCVPLEYATIQEAINVAVDGDLVLVDTAYTQTGRISFAGKSITVRGVFTPTFDFLACEESFPFGVDLPGILLPLGATEPAVTIDHNNAVFEGFVVSGGSPGILCGIYSPTIRNCYIYTNPEIGISVDGGSPLIEDCCIRENEGPTLAGCGIDARGSTTTLTVRRCTFTENGGSAGALPAGGGALLDECAAGTFEDCLFTMNGAGVPGAPIAGGAIYSAGEGVTLMRCSFVGNVAEFTGGALVFLHNTSSSCSWTSANYVVGLCEFFDNAALSGGAIYTELTEPAPDVSITKSLFVRNEATGAASSGGALLCGFGEEHFVVTNCTFVDNTAADVISVGDPGGPVSSEAVVEVINGVVWDTTESPTYVPFMATAPGSVRPHYSDIWNCDSDCDPPTTNFDLDPLFIDPPTDDYGLTYDCGNAPPSDSPCIDTGDPNSPFDADGTRADQGAIPALRNLFKRGDATGNLDVNALLDGLWLLRYLFDGQAPPVCFDAGDVNDNGAVEFLDPLALLLWQYGGGAPPSAPGIDVCGLDPTVDDLCCEGVVDACNPAP